MERAGGSRGVVAFVSAVAMLLLLPHGAAPAAVSATRLRRNCTRSCGNVRIPFPFGVEPGCYHAAGFNLTCDRSYRPPRLFLGDGSIHVLEISVSDSTVRINSRRLVYTVGTGASTVHGAWGLGLPAGPFFPVGVKEQRGLGRLRHPGRRPRGRPEQLDRFLHCNLPA
ncbi:hypothetical protein PR202_ga21394 [Eleusine coracana subsp. coracana]|uniref:Wall-associated receptor kinase galacturonan-binding domain-containing protein n=1 Tax=Eleusine coracana subsp. coracana TaxID=191504 RepID=A0AAV5CZ12_ELECO|nr:hypothetical protein PR202_ga21394 [Eleusine coracana subsp. coracana]